MPLAVVDALEVVDVDERQHESPVGSERPVDLALQGHPARRPQVGAGELVDVGLLELELGALAVAGGLLAVACRALAVGGGAGPVERRPPAQPGQPRLGRSRARGLGDLLGLAVGRDAAASRARAIASRAAAAAARWAAVSVRSRRDTKRSAVAASRSASDSSCARRGHVTACEARRLVAVGRGLVAVGGRLVALGLLDVVLDRGLVDVRRGLVRVGQRLGVRAEGALAGSLRAASLPPMGALLADFGRLS